MRTFSNGGKVAKIGFAVNNRKKNQQSGQWEDDPVFLDIDAFNRETGRKLADLVEQYLRKGNQVYIEGNLVLDQWTDKDGQKRSKLKIVLQDLQFLEPKSDGANSDRGDMAARAPRASAPAAPRKPEPNYSNGGGGAGYGSHDEPESMDSGRNADDDIPF